MLPLQSFDRLLDLPRQPGEIVPRQPERRAERHARVEVRAARLREATAHLSKAERHGAHEDAAEHPGEQTP